MSEPWAKACLGIAIATAVLHAQRRLATALLDLEQARRTLARARGKSAVSQGWIGAGGPVVPATQTIASCKAAKTC